MNLKKIFPALSAVYLSLTANASAFSVEHQFFVTVGIFDASKTTFSYGLTDDSYFVKSNVKTNGLFNTVYPFEGIYSTTGKIKGGELETTSYKYQSKSRFNKRSKELIYDKNGKPIYAVTSKNGKEKKSEVNPKLNSKDTTDLQTVFAEMAKQYNKLGFCRSRMEVFDGKRRFDVIFEDEGQEDLTQTELSSYIGKARKCSMYIDKLKEKGDDLLWEATSSEPVYFWILKDEKTKIPFIAKILVNNMPLGKLEAFTQRVVINE